MPKASLRVSCPPPPQGPVVPVSHHPRHSLPTDGESAHLQFIIVKSCLRRDSLPPCSQLLLLLWVATPKATFCFEKIVFMFCDRFTEIAQGWGWGGGTRER